MKLSQHHRTRLVRNALATLGIQPADRSLALRRFKRALSEGRLSDHAFTTLVDRIEADPKKAMREIRTWSPPIGIVLKPAPPEWLRPAWRLATMSYWQAAIGDLVSDLSSSTKPNSKPMRQSEMAEALREIARSARTIVNRLAHAEIAEFLEVEVACEFLDPPQVLRHKDGSATVTFPPPKLRRSAARTRTSKRDGVAPSEEYFPSEQSLYALFPEALLCALQDLQRLADCRADQIKDKGGATVAEYVLRPPLKRGLAIKCIAMIREEKGTLPKPRDVLSLIESIWALAGLNPESFVRPIKEALALFKGKRPSDPTFRADC